MSSEWAKRFKQFALAVDYVDENIVDEIKELLERYFEKTLRKTVKEVIDDLDIA